MFFLGGYHVDSTSSRGQKVNKIRYLGPALEGRVVPWGLTSTRTQTIRSPVSLGVYHIPPRKHTKGHHLTDGLFTRLRIQDIVVKDTRRTQWIVCHI